MAFSSRGFGRSGFVSLRHAKSRIHSDPSPTAFYTDSNPTAIGDWGLGEPRNAFNTTLSQVGTNVGTCYLSAQNDIGAIRLSYKLPSVKNVFKIRVNNYHSWGGATVNGFKALRIYTSEDPADHNQDYGVVSANQVMIFDGEFSQHTEVDDIDPFLVALTNTFTSADNISFDLINNYGGNYIGVRSIEIG